MLTFLHISDTHISADPDYRPHWLQKPLAHPNRRVETLLETIAGLPFGFDFILHTGDICAEPEAENYRVARDLLDRFEQPMFLLPGNHDSPQMARDMLADGERRRVLGDDHLVVNGYHLITIDASGGIGDPVFPTAPVEQIDNFAALLSQAQDGPILVAAHYPFVRTGVPWIDDGARIQNGERLHELLAARRERVAGVFYGHIHQVATSFCDGITYACCPSTWFSFTGFPGMQQADADLETPGGFNLVMIRDKRTFVRRYFLPPLGA